MRKISYAPVITKQVAEEEYAEILVGFVLGHLEDLETLEPSNLTELAGHLEDITERFKRLTNTQR